MKISVIMPIFLSEPAWWYKDLADYTIKNLRKCTTIPFELVIVEIQTEEFKDKADLHLKKTERHRYWQDINAGIEASSGDFVVHTGTDFIVTPEHDWLKALIEPFQKYKDCGISSLGAIEGNGVAIGPRQPMNMIVESVYCPFMMFRREWRFDELYPGMYGDNDMVMRMYSANLRAYRNCAVVPYHLHGATSRTSVDPERDEHEKTIGSKLFYERWRGSPWLMTRLFIKGAVAWGREHEI